MNDETEAHTGHPQRDNYESDQSYQKAWLEYYGTRMERTQYQLRLLIKRYGIKQVSKMEGMTEKEVRREAGTPSFKDKMSNLRKSIKK